MVSRAERTVLGDWWWTIDRALLAALAALMVSGLVFLMAGGPPVAERLGLSTFHFVNRQVLFLAPTALILVCVSFLSLRHIRRLALAVYVVSMVLVLLAFQFGPEIKGAHRWIMIGGMGVQPSEFLKPAFVMLAAWAFSEGAKRKDMPGPFLALVLLPVTIVPLILQPDFGQTMLVTIVWCGLFFVAGLHWFWVLGLGGLGVGGIVAAYQFLPHVRARIERFMDKSSGDTFQVDTAMESFSRGGWLGRGPGEGTVKRILPDAHTDFIFAVIAEEYGVLACVVLLGLFGLVAVRVFTRHADRPNAFAPLAAAGLVLLFALQAIINMAVNVGLVPAKGITLPFISNGGSSMLAVGLTMGMLLAVTRRRPDPARVKKPGLVSEPAT
jgi:cell division protein FtsW